MAKLSKNRKENPSLHFSVLKDGRQSLYLWYYLGRSQVIKDGKPKVHHIRKKYTLNMYLLPSPRTAEERQRNKDILAVASAIRNEREQQLMADKTGVTLKITAGKTNLLDHLEAYAKSYTKKDVRMITGALRRFKDFLAERHPILSHNIQPTQLTPDMVRGFVQYLEARSKGFGAHSYYQRFRKMIAHLADQGFFVKNPCAKISCKIDEHALVKEVFSEDELQLLASNPHAELNDAIRRGFLFTLLTGIRFCDLKDLTFSNVDFANQTISYRQNKTQKMVKMPLTEQTLGLIGEKGEKIDKIFRLPSSTMCSKALKRWVRHAGIDKHITWHCGRHSFGTITLNKGANIKVVSELLGHSSLRHTEKYIRAVDSLKKEAVESLPKLTI